MLLCGFNWASTSRSRKRGITRAKFGEVRKLQLGLDLAVEETCWLCPDWPRVPAGFNWASTSRSRKPSGMTPSSTPAARLQLGLDLAVEETLPSLLCPRSR